MSPAKRKGRTATPSTSQIVPDGAAADTMIGSEQREEGVSRKRRLGASEALAMASSAESREAPGPSKEEQALALLDAPTLSALRASPSPFLSGTLPPLPSTLASARVVAAVRIAATNPELAMFGIDGTGFELDSAAAAALGSLPVESLVFPLELRLTVAAAAAFAQALGTNAAVRSLRISCTNLDAAVSVSAPAGAAAEVQEGWRAEGSGFAQRVQELRREGSLPPLLFLGDESFGPVGGTAWAEVGEEGEGGSESEEGEGGSEDEGEGEGEEDPCVQCDRKSCRREVTDPDETVFTNTFGQDYCGECARAMGGPRAGWRQLSVAARLAEVLGRESGGRSGA